MIADVSQRLIRDRMSDDLSVLQDVYESAYARIYRKLGEAKKDVNYATYAKQIRLLKRIGAEIDRLKQEMSTGLADAVRRAAVYSTGLAIKNLDELGISLTNAAGWHFNYNAKHAEQTGQDSRSRIAGQTAGMKRSVKTLLRNEAARVFRRAAVEGVTRQKAYKALKTGMLERSLDFKFVDKSGRQWDAGKYFEMLARTIIANTLRETYINTLVNEGQDLVKVSSSGAKDACRRWEGRVLSITGATEGHVTIEEAKATGEIFHPRCVHRVVAYCD